MRAVMLLVTVAVGGCHEYDPIDCSGDSECTLHSGGLCHEASSGRRWCSYPDTEGTCESGRRWSEVAGPAVAGECVGLDELPPDAAPPVSDGGEDGSLPVDAGVDAPSGDASASGDWTVPAVVLDTTGLAQPRDPWIASDGLSLYFTAFVSGQRTNLYLATRASTSLPFGAPAPIAALNSADNDYNPVVAPDNLEILFARWSEAAGTQPKIMRATRASQAVAWQPPVETGLLGYPSSISADGLVLYYAPHYSSACASGTAPCFFRAARPTLGGTWGGPVQFDLSSDADYLRSPAVSSDGSRVLVSGAAASSGNPMIMEGVAVGDGFGEFVGIPALEIGVDLIEGAVWSATETEIYFAGDPVGSTGLKLYVSVRQ
jgi:hypothetical protein